MSAALVIIPVIFASVNLVLIGVVVVVGLTTSDPDRRRTALAMLKILRPLATLYARKKN